MEVKMKTIRKQNMVNDTSVPTQSASPLSTPPAPTPQPPPAVTVNQPKKSNKSKTWCCCLAAVAAFFLLIIIGGIALAMFTPFLSPGLVPSLFQAVLKKDFTELLNNQNNSQMQTGKENLTNQAATDYMISQTDNLPINKVIPGIANITGQAVLKSDGYTLLDDQSWHTLWAVVQESSMTTENTLEINRRIQTSPVDFTGKSSDRVVLFFDLTNVKEGQEFIIRCVRNGVYQGEISGPIQDVVMTVQGEVIYLGKIKPQSQESMDKGEVELKAKLLKDLGDDGAIISYGWSVAGKAEEFVKWAKEMALQSGLADLADLPEAATSGEPIQLRIKRTP